MGNINTNSTRKSNLPKITLVLLFLIILAVPGYYFYKVFVTSFLDEKKEVDNQEEVVEEKEENVEEEEEDSEPVMGSSYIERLPVIDGQQAYITIPNSNSSKNPPYIVIFSHGSNTNVTSNLEDPFMMDMKSYGEKFSASNYIFAASNQHDVNWGSQTSIDDMTKMVDWIHSYYSAQSKVFLIGHSMGGLPTMYYALQNPESVLGISLLAPTIRSNDWDQYSVAKIKDIPITIWHGVDDVNIGLYNSKNFQTKLSSLGKDITLNELEGKAHFDVDTEYMDEILFFFESVK